MSHTAHIIHEAPSQRRTHRLNAPITVFINDVPHRTIDWSLIDFKVANYNGNAQKGEKFPVIIQVPYQGFHVSFQVTATAIHHNNEQQTLACEFNDVDERSREILETFVAGLVRGEMENIHGVIRRMDVPVTPASLKPDIALTEGELKAQERKRVIGSAIYLGAGFLFLIALLCVMYTNFFQIKVETAVLTAPTDILIAPATGEIAAVHVTEHQNIEQEKDLITFTDPALEQEIQRADLKLKELNLTTKDGIKPSSEEESARASVNALQRSLDIKSSSLNRIGQLMNQGLARRIDYDKAQGEYFQAKAELSKAMERLSNIQNGGSANSLGAITLGEFNLLKAQRERLTLKAPANGSIVHLMQREGTSVRYGDPIAVFEHNGPRYIEASITREEALSVAIGDKASVYFPSHNQNIDFRVSDVDYTSRLISKREGMFVLEQAGMSRDVVVRLVLDEKDQQKLIEKITPGTSAVVVFSKLKWGSNDSVSDETGASPTQAVSVPTAVSVEEVKTPLSDKK